MNKREALYKDVSSLEVVAYTTRDGDFEDGVIFILEKLDAIPVADVEPIRHGKWIPVIDEYETMSILTCYRCSLCGRYEKEKELYCHCGAKMEGD